MDRENDLGVWARLARVEKDVLKCNFPFQGRPGLQYHRSLHRAGEGDCYSRNSKVATVTMFLDLERVLISARL